MTSRQSWNEWDMQAALDVVSSNVMGYQKAANFLGVKKQHLFVMQN